MAHVINTTLEFTGGSTYLLREGGDVNVRLATGYGEPFNADEVARTRLTVWCPTGNVYVAEDGDGIDPITVQIPAALRGPYVSGVEKRTTVVYEGQPGEPAVEFNIRLQAKPWAYSDETVYFKTELLRGDDTVYADNGRNIGGRTVYPQIRLRLGKSIAAVEHPEDPSNGNAWPLGAKANLVTWSTPVPATATKLYYASTLGGAQTLIDTVGVGTNAWYYHTGLTADTEYFYYAKCENDAGSSDTVYLGMAKTLALPTIPDAPEVTSALTPNATTLVVTFEDSEEFVSAGVVYPNTYTLYVRLTSDSDIAANYSERIVEADKRRAVIQGLTADTSYTYYMTATNDGGESAGTTKTAITTPDGSGEPTQPTDMLVTTVDHETQTISWSMTFSNEEGFGLYYSTDEVDWTAVRTDAPLSAGTTSYTQTGLTPGTLYYWRVFSFNHVAGVETFSEATQESATTEAAPSQPSAVTEVGTQVLDNARVTIFWEQPTTATQTAFKVLRSTTEAGTYTVFAQVASNVTHAVDYGRTANTTYYYRVDAVGASGDVTGTTIVSATMTYEQRTIHPVCGFELDPESRNQIKEVAGRAIITSDLNRWIVRVGTNWYKAGLRPIRGDITFAKTTGGVLEDGTYRVYLVLVRGETRSIPSEPSATVTISDTSKTLVVTPPLNDDSDEVECRDWGYDINGDVITAADGWEIYLAEENQGQAYRIARLPMAVADWEDSVGAGTYTIDDALTVNDIFGGTRRPMEQQLESSLPPACAWIETTGNRVVCSGEVDIIPSDSAGSATVVAGNDYFTTTNWDATDACLYKHVFWNGLDTGWEVYDYDYDAVDTTEVTKCYIRHRDPSINEGGFNFASGTYTDVELRASPNRVYYSAYFSGAALNQVVYSPETFPPLTIMENEFFPDDNNSISALISTGESLLAAKDEKWILAVGGDEPDFPLIQTRAVSRGSGLNAPYSVARDANGVVYYLGDTGPFRVTQGGVEKANIRFGNQRMFHEVFEMSSVPNAKGAWFSRNDWYVVTGLNRLGKSGNLSGFVLDVRNGAIMPFATPYEFTHIKEYKSSAGEFQLLFGAENGRMGYMFKRGLYVDGVDYTQTYAMDSAQVIKCRLRTGVVDSEHAISPDWIQPRVKAIPRDADFTLRLEVDGKDRCSDPLEFEMVDYVEFDTDTDCDRIRMAGGRFNQIQFELTGSTRTDRPNASFELRELPLRAVVRNAS